MALDNSHSTTCNGRQRSEASEMQRRAGARALFMMAAPPNPLHHEDTGNAPSTGQTLSGHPQVPVPTLAVATSTGTKGATDQGCVNVRATPGAGD